MSNERTDKTLEFKLEGRFLNFAASDGYKLKYLRLSTAQGEYLIKLSKDLRQSLYRKLTPGDWIQVVGSQKIDTKRGTIKFKAYEVTATAPNQPSVEPQADSSEPAIAPLPIAKSCILVCQKSDCCKRGGRAVTAALQQELSDRGIDDRVKIKGTGCMKRCKAGPNIVMPDKTRYSRINRDDVAEIVDRHFPHTVEPKVIEPEVKEEEILIQQAAREQSLSTVSGSMS